MFHKKIFFQLEKKERIDYKDLKILRRCITENGKIMPARLTGLTRIHQKQLKQAIERARFLGLLPYVVE